jgi:hypothetical protein
MPENALYNRGFLKILMSTLALTCAAFAIGLANDVPSASASNGTCNAFGVCEFNCNPQARESWCWFNAPGGENARNWFRNTAEDFYESHVWKCAAAIRADNGNTYKSTCNSNQLTFNEYEACFCGGLYIRSWNNATGPRYIYSYGYIY